MGGAGAALARVFINDHVGALGFSLSPHRQEEGFKFTLLNEQNDFRPQAPGLLLLTPFQMNPFPFLSLNICLLSPSCITIF